ncbi:MAG: NAD(P)H-binding protein [Deltaproteobacteria bacterium]|nr:NAD(P)H-binding protein [Deltaproteobacteria bacterium]
MRVAVVGATGGIGRHVVDLALAAGHDVRALARDPKKLHRVHERLAPFASDARTGAGLLEAIDRCALVLSCLGTRRGEAPVVAEGTRHLVEACTAAGVGRLAIISSLGVGDSRPQALRTGVGGTVFFRVVVPLFLRRAFADLEEAERVARGAPFPVVCVRPGGLTDEPAVGSVVAVGPELDLPLRIPRADVAAFLLSLLHDTRWDGKAVSLGAR